MKVPLRWLAEYVDLTLPVEDLAHRLTMAGVEVERIERSGGDWDNVYVGLVTAVTSHPNADRLRLATIDTGRGEPQIVVCGAPNVAEGQKVAFAVEGATLIDAHSGERRKLKRSTIRGVESAGMVCSNRELGISDEHDGIRVLPDDLTVGTPLTEALGQTVLDLSLTPNRPDLFAVLGVAREVAALTDRPVRSPSADYPAAAPPIEESAGLSIEAPDLCLRYVAALVRNVKVAPSPDWLQQRLQSAGMRPISNIVDVSNFVMLETGQPLHAFDFDKLAGARIVVRRARAEESLHLLDGTERRLAADQLVIADAERALAVAGVMGGDDSEVSRGTTTVLLESANFHGPSVRRTAAALKLRTEASTRFEKGLNPDLALEAARRATQLLVEIGGGEAHAGFLDAYPGRRDPVVIDVPAKRLHQVLGVDLPRERIVGTLARLGFAVTDSPDGYAVTAPFWRSDVTIADDVAEEVARIVGYDVLPSAPLTGTIPEPQPQPQPLRRVMAEARDALAAAGLVEVINYALSSADAIERVQPLTSISETPPLGVANPMSAERTLLRTTLRPGLLDTYAANRRHQRGPIGLFEVGRLFLPRDGDLPLERTLAAALYGGPLAPAAPGAEPRLLDFFDAKAIVQALAAAMRLDLDYEPSEDPALVPGHAAALRLDGDSVGLLGQVHPDVCARFEIDDEVYLFELDLDALASRPRPAPRFVEPSRFPAVAEDLAVVVDEATPAAAVERVLLRQKLVESAALFDVYAGAPIPEGKKSLAFAINYRAPDRTLTEAEVARARTGIVRLLQKELGASIRDQ